MKDGFYLIDYKDNTYELYAVWQGEAYTVVSIDFTILPDLIPGISESVDDEYLLDAEYLGEFVYNFGKYSEHFSNAFILGLKALKYSIAVPEQEISDNYQRLLHGCENFL